VPREKKRRNAHLPKTTPEAESAPEKHRGKKGLDVPDKKIKQRDRKGPPGGTMGEKGGKPSLKKKGGGKRKTTVAIFPEPETLTTPKKNDLEKASSNMNSSPFTSRERKKKRDPST